MRDYLYSKYIGLYSDLDAAHGELHINTVLSNIEFLCSTETQKVSDQAFVAGLLHDVGLFGGRNAHEVRGADFVISEGQTTLSQFFTTSEIKEISGAVKNHRASTGYPTTNLEMIVSDADRIDPSPLRRAYEYQTKKLGTEHSQAIKNAAKHLTYKFDVGGTGRRYYFSKTLGLIKKYYDPIIQECKNREWDKLELRL